MRAALACARAAAASTKRPLRPLPLPPSPPLPPPMVARLSTAITSSSAAKAAAGAATSAPLELARRRQEHLEHGDTAPATSSGPANTGGAARGGPTTLEQLRLRVLARSPNFVVLNKGADERLDGAFDVTIEKALYRDFPDVEKFRWIHQLDFATSGVMCVGIDKTATALACRLFREKHVQKEYLAVVRGKLPFHPRDLIAGENTVPFRACTLSKLGMLIQDTEAWERLRVQRKGSREHQRQRDYPRGPRQAPAFFNMDQARLRKLASENEVALSEEETALLHVRWRELPAEVQRKYTAQAEADKERYLDELAVFLDREKERLARKRKYESLDGGDGGQTKLTRRQDHVEVGENDGADAREDEEPVAYVFDDPIVEPKGGDAFRMQIGERATYDSVRGGKASTTIAFVLGHGTFAGEDVAKVLLRPLSGRRHQLRLHLAHHGFPILGDATYGPQDDYAPRMMLHAWKLWLRASPKEQEEYGELFFTTPDPFEEIVDTQRAVSTITYYKQQEEQQRKQEQAAATTEANAAGSEAQTLERDVR